MKMTYTLRNLDCANCALKMERAIAALPEVQSVSVSFLSQKLRLELVEGAAPEAVMKKVARLVHKVEPDCEVQGL